MILRNFGYLSLLNLITIAFPLLTYPYLIETIGVDNFSKAIYVQAVIGYFIVFVSFGINVSGTKLIATCRTDEEKTAKIFWQLFSVKLMLALISLIVLIPLVMYTEKGEYYLLTIPLIYAEVFFPQWYYQGMEKMKNITLINLVSRVAILFLIVLIIKRPEDIYKYLFVFSFIPFLVSFLSFTILLSNEKLKFKREYYCVRELIHVIDYSLPMFYSSSLSVVKDRTNVIIIGLLIGPHQVVVYDFLIKVINVISGFYSSFTNAQFPYFVKNKDKEKYNKYTSIVTISSLLVVVVSILSFFLVKSIDAFSSINIFKILYFPEFNSIFYWLIWLVPLRAISYQIGMCYLIPAGLEKQYSLTLLISTLIYVIGNGFIYFIKINDLNFILFILIFSVIFEVVYRKYASMKVINVG